MNNNVENMFRLIPIMSSSEHMATIKSKIEIGTQSLHGWQ